MIILCSSAGPCLNDLLPILSTILLFLFIITSVPLLMLSITTKNKIVSVKRIFQGILIIFVLSILEIGTYTVYSRATFVDVGIVRSNTDMKSITSMLELYRAENNTLPTTEQGLQALVSNPDPKKYTNWRKYMKALPIDYWKNKYQYLNPGQHGEFDIYSLGFDGIQSEDDFGNW